MTVLTYTKNGVNEIIIFDATTKQSPKFEAEVTSHPSQKGSNFSDHSRAKPLTLSLEILVSDQPLQKTRQDYNLTITGDGRSRDTMFTLETIWREAILCNIDTGLRSYQNMLLKNITPANDSSVSKALKATLDFQELIVVDSITVDIVRPRRTGNKEKSEANAGKEGTKEADPKQRVSLLEQLAKVVPGR